MGKPPIKLGKLKGRKGESVPRQRKLKNAFNNTSLTKLPVSFSNRAEIPGLRSVMPFRASKGYLEVYTANIIE